ncbi:MAG: hypothetical protein FJW56_05870 [Actinobacteria bacterium]|nr:hypothetical protein [Actinomycetota bacterium]
MFTHLLFGGLRFNITRRYKAKNIEVKMKTIYYFFFVLFSLLIFYGCATPYQPHGFLGGYSDQYLGNDTYMIAVSVNGYTSSATAYSYFHRRASELVYQNGYRRYEVLDWGQSANYGIMTLGDTPFLYNKPSIYGRIRCYR